MNLSLTERPHGDATVVGVRGEFDILTAPKVGTLLDEVVRRPAGDVVVDLRQTEFIDSSGLAVLLNASRRLGHGSRRMIVICRAGPVQRAIEFARLTDTLGVVSSVDGLD